MENKNKKKTKSQKDEAVEKMIDEMIRKHKEQSEAYDRKRKAQDDAHSQEIRSCFNGPLARMKSRVSKPQEPEKAIDEINLNIIDGESLEKDSTIPIEDPDPVKSHNENVTMVTEETTPPSIDMKTENEGSNPKSVVKEEDEVNRDRESEKSDNVSEASEKDNQCVDNDGVTVEMIAPTTITSMDNAGEEFSKPDGEHPKSKATRISAKMRRASRAEFHDTYLIKTDTKGGKPITIAPDLIERAYRICIRSGDYKTCPTYLFNNLIREVLDFIEPDTEAWATLD